jgi:hypothetical protein
MPLRDAGAFLLPIAPNLFNLSQIQRINGFFSTGTNQTEGAKAPNDENG